MDMIETNSLYGLPITFFGVRQQYLSHRILHLLESSKLSYTLTRSGKGSVELHPFS